MRFMRSGAWLVVGGLALTLPIEGCSGGYPLPPTRCDEWCDATKGGYCQDYYLPASCVVECEQAHLSHEACKDQFDLALSCFRSSPRALKQRCVYDNQPDDCESEAQALTVCAVGTVSFPE